MNKKVLLSIITVCFNSEKTISKTLESVLEQDYDNYEYIIIDGGSTDNTLRIIEEFSEKFNGKLKYISEPDNGIYNAMNKGIKLAKGDYIGIINSDDYYEPHAFSNIVSNIDTSKPQIIYGFLRVLNNGIEKIIYLTSHHNINNEMIPHPTCFISSSVYKEYGVYNEEYKSCADYEFLLRLPKENILFTQVHRIIANFNMGGMSERISSKIETIKMKNKVGLLSDKKAKKDIIKLNLKRLLGKR